MRKLAYILLGLLLVAGSGAFLLTRQLRVADGDKPAAAPTATTRSITRENGGDKVAVTKPQRNIDKGIEQYRTPEGGWKLFEAVIDVLNVVVGLIGIGLAVSGMRMRRDEAVRN
jgi:hypothetical protein